MAAAAAVPAGFAAAEVGAAAAAALLPSTLLLRFIAALMAAISGMGGCELLGLGLGAAAAAAAGAAVVPAAAGAAPAAAAVLAASLAAAAMASAEGMGGWEDLALGLLVAVLPTEAVSEEPEVVGSCRHTSVQSFVDQRFVKMAGASKLGDSSCRGMNTLARQHLAR